MKNWMILFFIVCTLFANSKAQEEIHNDLLKVSYEHGFNAKAKSYDYNLSKKQLNVEFSIPFNLKSGKDHLYILGGYNYTQLHHDAYSDPKLNLHAVELGLGWYKAYKNPYWAHYLDFGLGVASDFKSLDAEFLNVGLTSVFYYGKSDKFILNFGVNYTGGVFGHWVTPIIGFNSTINEKLYIHVDLFNEALIEYLPHPNFSFGAELYANPYSFGITDYYGVKNSAVYAYGEKYLSIPWKSNLFFNVHIKDKWLIFIKGGIDINNQVYHFDRFGQIINESAYNGKTNVPFSFEVGFKLKGDVLKSLKFK